MAVQLILLYNVIYKVKINYLRSNWIYLGLKKIMAQSARRTVWTNVLWWLEIKLTDGLCKRSIFWKIRAAANWINTSTWCSFFRKLIRTLYWKLLPAETPLWLKLDFSTKYMKASIKLNFLLTYIQICEARKVINLKPQICA